MKKNIIDIVEGKRHHTGHTICILCLNREMSIWPVGTNMKILECDRCGKTGGLILTNDPKYRMDE